MLTGGGESCADIEHLRLQSDLFGSVASDSTVHWTFHELDAETLGELAKATAEVRATVRDRLGLNAKKEPVTLDIDASIVEIHSENKEGAAPHFRGGFGFYPMFCFAEASGEALSARLRPGNASANTVADHVAVLDGAIEQLPAAVDSAGCTEGFVNN